MNRRQRRGQDEKTCIEIVPIFSGLTFDEMLEVESITSVKNFKKGEIIYSAGDIGNKLYVPHIGRVKISRIASNGKEQVIRVVGPGDFLGELSIFNEVPLQEDAQALEDTTMCVIEGKKLKVLMGKYPEITFKVMGELSKRLEMAENLIEDINLRTVEERLATALLKMAGDEDEVILNMTKGDFASQMGMSQETLSRKLSAFQDQGLIEQKGNRIIILLDKESLKEYS